jgi:YbbR domain-containing protein
MAFRDFILDRFWLKLFSFILATLIWFTVSNVQTETRVTFNPFRPAKTREVYRAVRLSTLPTNRRFFEVDPPEVRIVVRGSAESLDRLSSSDLQPFVNLTDPPETAGSYPVEVRRLPATLNLHVVAVTPQMVMVRRVSP